MQSSETIDRLRDEGKWLDAAAILAGELEEDPSSRHKWVDYAHMLKEGGAFEEAAYAYRAAIRRDGTAPDPRLHLSHLLKRLGRAQEALSEFLALEKLPNAPPVAQEIAGLRVSLLQEAWPTTGTKPLEDAGGNDFETVFQRLRQLEDRRAEAAPTQGSANALPRAKTAGSKIMPFGLLASSRQVRATLVPQSDLIIRDDVLIATTNAPQFRVEIEGEPLQPGWFEVEVQIKAPVPFIEPVFFLEHKAEWSSFSHYRLHPLAGGKFHALGYCEDPVLRLRLDPLTFAGSLEVAHFKVRQVGLANAVRAAHGKDAQATRRAVRNIRTHRSAQSFEREIADILRCPGKSSYQKWIDVHGTQTAQQIGVRIRTAARWQKQPLFSLIVFVSSLNVIDNVLTSLSGQQYGNWQARFIPSAALAESDRRRLAEILRDDARCTIDASLLSAVTSSSGDYTVMVDADGAVAPDALYRIAERFIAQPLAELVYADEDHADAEGARHTPLFKPDWDFDYFLASGYLGNLVAVRTATLHRAVEQADLSADASPFDVVASCTFGLDSERISHITSVLYHRYAPVTATEPPLDVLPLPKSQFDPRAIERLLHRANADAGVETLPSGLVKVCWPLPKSPPKVTLIIPTRDRVSLLSSCIDSLLRETAYPSFEILIVDNNSVEPKTLDYFQTIQENENIKVLSMPGEFNYSRLNNEAARQASGDLIGLVNNDILAIDDKWLAEMVSHAIRPDIGAVGARLVYKSGHIQHAGIVCGIGLVAGHPHKYRAAGDLGYMGRLGATQTLSAVTAACLVVEKKKYFDVGGLDEENLQIAFNDVDLCLKLDAAGYRNIYTPHAELVHLESISRGLDTSIEKVERYQKEAAFMMQKWSERIKRDPHYSPNLTLEREDYSLRD